MANERRIGRYFSTIWRNLRLGGVKSITLSVDGNNIDVSDADSGRWTNLVSGRKNPAFDITMNYVQDDAGQIAVASAMLSEDTFGAIAFGPLGDPQASDVWFGGQASVSNVSISAGEEDVAEITCTADVSGELYRFGGTPVVTTSATYSLSLASNTVLHLNRSAGVTVTLPVATGTKRTVIIIDKSGNAGVSAHTINPNGANTIAGNSSASISANFGRIALIDDAAGLWRVIFSFGTTLTP